MTPFQERLHGVIPALLTPLTSELSADTDALRRLVRRVVDAGCHGFVLMGATGEFASIDDADRAGVIRVAVAEASGKVPVIVGCGQPNVQRVHNQTKEAADHGADGTCLGRLVLDEGAGHGARVQRVRGARPQPPPPPPPRTPRPPH